MVKNITVAVLMIFGFLYSGLNDNLLSETYNGDLKKVKFLIKKGADVNCVDGFGNAPLHIACTNNIKVVEVLLSSGADPNSCNADEDTPLHKAAISGNHEIIKLLIKNKADPYKKNKSGNTAFMLAVSKNYSEVINAFIEADKKLISEKNEKGSEAVHFAAENGNLKIFILLIDNGADIEAQDAFGNTPLMIAARNGQIYIAEYILSKK